MRYYKLIIDGYIIAVGTGTGGMEISEGEYLSLLELIHNRPNDAPDGYAYRLRDDLTWELYELPELPEEDEEATLYDTLCALAELGVE